jgi:hypothetical protein
MRILLLFLASLMFASCSPKSVVDTLSTEEEREFVQSVVQELRAGRGDKVAEHMPAEKPDEVAAVVSQVSPLLQKAGTDYEILSVAKFWSDVQEPHKVFQLEGGAGENWAIVEVALSSDSKTAKILGFHVTAMTESRNAAASFANGKAGWRGYLWIAAMVMNVALCVAALRVVWRRKWIKRRWLWTIVSLIGLTAFRLNWTTGEWGFAPIQFQFLGAAVFKTGPFEPWILAFSIPLLPAFVLWKFAMMDIHPAPLEDDASA